MIKLTAPTSLTLDVDPNAYLHAPQERDNLWYLLNRLFSGEAIAEEELRSWGITIAENEFVRVQRGSLDVPPDQWV